ncbi:unnamed protein product, partial [Discosporangium mesarthrocarpum]
GESKPLGVGVGVDRKVKQEKEGVGNQETGRERRIKLTMQTLEKERIIPWKEMVTRIHVEEGSSGSIMNTHRAPRMDRKTFMWLLKDLKAEGKIELATLKLEPGSKLSFDKRWKDRWEFITVPGYPKDRKSLEQVAQAYIDAQAKKKEERGLRKPGDPNPKTNPWFQSLWDVTQKSRLLWTCDRTMQRSSMLHGEILLQLPFIEGLASYAIDMDRVLAHLPLGTFIAMFGYPPDEYYTRPHRGTVIAAVRKKALVKEAPAFLKKLFATLDWYHEDIRSSLQVLEDMKLITRAGKGSAPQSTPSGSTNDKGMGKGKGKAK